jgi:hypothetical protein
LWNDPERIVFRDLAKRSLRDAGLGSVGEKAAAAIADYVVLDMFGNFCIGDEDAKGAIKIASVSCNVYIADYRRLVVTLACSSAHRSRSGARPECGPQYRSGPRLQSYYDGARRVDLHRCEPREYGWNGGRSPAVAVIVNKMALYFRNARPP